MLDDSVVQARLEKEPISGVDHFHVVVCPDHTGDDAVYIYVVMPDSVVEDDDLFSRFFAIENRIFQICQDEFSGYWPYTRLRVISDMKSCLKDIEARRQHAAISTMLRRMS